MRFNQLSKDTLNRLQREIWIVETCLDAIGKDIPQTHFSDGTWHS